jgi:D-glycero-D-manno-heptose 1,7-bisphosphate phosphatase
MGEKIVFLDRDGVINKLVERDGRQVSPRTFNDFEILPGVPVAIRKLQERGFKIVVVTNQPDISRGLMRAYDLELMHQLVYSLGVETIRFCPHTENDNCICRKPRPGLLVEQLRTSKYSPTEIWMIGDNTSDVLAGKAVGAQTVLICSGNDSLGASPDLIANDLLAAVDMVLKKTKR